MLKGFGPNVFRKAVLQTKTRNVERTPCVLFSLRVSKKSAQKLTSRAPQHAPRSAQQNGEHADGGGGRPARAIQSRVLAAGRAADSSCSRPAGTIMASRNRAVVFSKAFATACVVAARLLIFVGGPYVVALSWTVGSVRHRTSKGRDPIAGGGKSVNPFRAGRSPRTANREGCRELAVGKIVALREAASASDVCL